PKAEPCSQSSIAKFPNGSIHRTTGWSSCLLRPVLWNRYVTPRGMSRIIRPKPSSYVAPFASFDWGGSRLPSETRWRPRDPNGRHCTPGWSFCQWLNHWLRDWSRPLRSYYRTEFQGHVVEISLVDPICSRFSEPEGRASRKSCRNTGFTEYSWNGA